MDSQKTKAFIHQIIQLGFQAPARNFKELAVEQLRQLIGFDMALWASGHSNDLVVHDLYLYQLPDALMDSWEHFKREDRLLAAAIKAPGRTIDVWDVYGRRERSDLSIYREHSKAFGIENATCTLLPSPVAGLIDIMGLYRRRLDRPFTPEERQAKEFIFPLMIEAWHGNQIQHLRRKAGGDTNGALAICDKQGWIRHPEKRFMEMLLTEWPRWQAPALPEKLRRWLSGNKKGPFKGNKVAFLRTQLDDLILMQAHLRGEAVLLTTREEDIAESYSAGLTYKDIAAEYNLSPSTVRRHIESIYRKLGVSNKVELHQALNSR